MIVACVEVGDYERRGAEYVRKLQAMVSRNLGPHRFVCLTDEPGRHDVECQQIQGGGGWWAKIALFEPGRFPDGERILYLDLDSVVVGDLRPLVAHKGLVHLADWGWTRNDYLSAVMLWDAGEHRNVWELYDTTIPFRFRGDQDYLTALGGWDALPKGLVCSYRYHATNGPPAGCSVIQFHGRPKPPDCVGWVANAWG